MNHIRVKFHCNLDDVMRREVWPEYLPVVPAVGDIIESARKYKGIKTTGGTHGQKVVEQEIVMRLQVVSVTWKPKKREGNEYSTGGIEWIPEIELDVISSPFKNITNWKEWYERLIPA